jgi:hypothetical protein
MPPLTTKQNFAKYLKTIFADGEWIPDSVFNYGFTTATDSKSYRVSYYNSDTTLVVAYRVRSTGDPNFRAAERRALIAT